VIFQVNLYDYNYTAKISIVLVYGRAALRMVTAASASL